MEHIVKLKVDYFISIVYQILNTIYHVNKTDNLKESFNFFKTIIITFHRLKKIFSTVSFI